MCCDHNNNKGPDGFFLSFFVFVYIRVSVLNEDVPTWVDGSVCLGLASG